MCHIPVSPKFLLAVVCFRTVLMMKAFFKHLLTPGALHIPRSGTGLWLGFEVVGSKEKNQLYDVTISHSPKSIP